MIDLHEHRHGSAGGADARMRRQAGLNNRAGFYIGTDEAGRHCHSNQQASLMICGGARSLKGSLIIPSLVDGCLNGDFGPANIISMDWKKQNGEIAALQVKQGRHIISIAPRDDGSNSIDVLSYIDPKSPELIPRAKLFAANWIPYSGSPQAQYFEGTAQRLTEAVLVTRARLMGSVTLPDLADVMSGLGDATDDWLSFEYHLSVAPEAQYRKVAQELSRLREQGSDSGGYNGIKNEIAKAFSVMSDPQWRKVLSPPFDFCPSQLTLDGAPPYLVNIAENKDYAQTSAGVLRAIYTSFLIYKRRAPVSTTREQVWLLDEIGNIGAWPMAVELATFGPGYRIRPIYVVQSTAQFDNLAPHASTIVPNSCGTQIFMGIRSVEQASLVSRQLGKTTLEYHDPAQIERAEAARSKALMGMVLGGADPVTAIMTASHNERMARQPKYMPRDLRTPDELLREPNGRAFVFMPGVLEQPFYAHIPKYWCRRDLAGKYLGDPFHAKPGTVEIKTWLGQRHRQVITEPVPAKYADWPQYRRSGLWSYVKGFRP